MANQRPIRRGRFPRFRRGRRKPVRWIDGNSSGGFLETCGVTTFVPLCDPNLPRELLVGDLDVDWSDKSEVLINRVVGSMLVSHQSARTEALTPWPYHLVLRTGMLVTEDTDRLYQTIDLFDQESLEEYEWMWLDNRLLPQENIFPGQDFGGGNVFFAATGSATIPIDVRSKRKLGKKDSLVLYSQVKMHVPEPLDFSFSISCSAQLRTVLS